MTVSQIHPTDVRTLVPPLPPQGRTIELLDVREPWELAIASVPSTADLPVRHIPMQQVPTALATLTPDHTYVVLCHHGMRSQHIAMYLQQQGYPQVFNVAGGIDAWTHEVDPGVPAY